MQSIYLGKEVEMRLGEKCGAAWNLAIGTVSREPVKYRKQEGAMIRFEFLEDKNPQQPVLLGIGGFTPRCHHSDPLGQLPRKHGPH